MPAKRYTDKQKLAYYKRKAALRGRGAYYAPRRRMLKGRGGYYDSKFVKTMRGYVPKGTFASGGAMAGKAIAGPLGGFLGSLAGKGLATLAGFGAYKVKSNSLMIDEGQSPAVMHSNSASCRIRHREYITDIISSGTANTFKLQNFFINPGLGTVFPWLSALAQQYQEWVPKGIVFEFKTLSADAIASSTNNTLGGIIMSTNYNSAATNFVNKQQMDNTEYTTSCKPSESIYHAIECAPHQNVMPDMYVRTGAVPSGQDQKTYDLGNFQIASFGVQGTSVVLGELWVSYDVELRKPILTAASGADVLTDHYVLGTVTNAHPLGTASVLRAGSSIGGTIDVGGNTYSFDPLLQEGTFLVSYCVNGANAVINPPVNTYTNCQALSVWVNDTQAYQYSPSAGTSSPIFQWQAVVKLTGLGATINWGGAGTLPATITSGDLVVTQWDFNIST